jgi:2,3-bisphosphoglycerate-dependent phosphoglycerate mutase
MKNLLLMLSLIVTTAALAQEKTTTIYLIRHAEKADGSTDPDLSEAGKERTKKWGAYFEDKNISTYYTTPYKRTIQTASFTSAFVSAMPRRGSVKTTQFKTYDPRTLSLKQVAQDNNGQSVVVVGHSNTIPAQINALLGQNIYPDMKEDEFGNLYIITITANNISHQMIKM